MFQIRNTLPLSELNKTPGVMSTTALEKPERAKKRKR